MSGLKVSVTVEPETGAAVAEVEFHSVVLKVQFKRSERGFEVSSAGGGSKLDEHLQGEFKFLFGQIPDLVSVDEHVLQDLMNLAGAVVADLGDAMGRAHLSAARE
jgi:hypothetical protein